MLLAELGAGAADFGAFATQVFVVRRLPGYEVGRRDADLGTVEKGHKVALLGMLGGPVQNVGHRLGAGGKRRGSCTAHVTGQAAHAAG